MVEDCIYNRKFYFIFKKSFKIVVVERIMGSSTSIQPLEQYQFCLGTVTLAVPLVPPPTQIHAPLYMEHPYISKLNVTNN